MSQIKILIAEDELIIAEDIKFLLEDLGYQVVEEVARNYQDGVRLFDSENPDLVLVDIILSGEKDGIDLAGTIRERSDTPLIFLTSHADASTVDRAKTMNPQVRRAKVIMFRRAIIILLSMFLKNICSGACMILRFFRILRNTTCYAPNIRS